MKVRFVLTVALLLTCVAGCGSGGIPCSPVTGTVTLSDGSPLDNGMVVFESNQISAAGMIGSDGKYSLKTYEPDDGAPEGSYKVYITAYSVPLDYEADGPPKIPFDARYQSLETTDLAAEVKAGDNVIDFKLEAPAD